ncbi:MAG: pyruvate kinase [Cyclobacteriaceae bacterium]|nr:pyruvate kinase [Cyclobacteriaceae bacterium]
MNNQEELIEIKAELEEIILKARKLEKEYEALISNVHVNYRASAVNLTHYLAFRSFDIDQLQEKLGYLGFPDLANIEGHVMQSLLNIKAIVDSFMGNKAAPNQQKIISIKQGEKLLNRNTKKLFGYKSRKRRTRIMVTMPSTASGDYRLVNQLIGLGMNSARVNCAHDSPEVWAAIIANINHANSALHKKCKVMMDLGGPKLRTGPMKPGPNVVHIQPKRDVEGKVIKPARVWVAPPDILPPTDDVDVIIPVSEELMGKIKRGNIIRFKDSRGKNCKIDIEKREKKGRWGVCSDSAYISTGTELRLGKKKADGSERILVGQLLPTEQFILLQVDDFFELHKEPALGEPAIYEENGTLIKKAHISCTLPEIFEDVKAGEPVFLNDGKIEAVIEEVNAERLMLRVTYAKDTGSKLKADKGINFPESDLKISGLTEKDKLDLEFVAENADAVNLSFVNQRSDVETYLEEIGKYEANPGLILKIETQKGFRNLPEILLTAMQTYPIGVMIARGDLAIETGWKNFATIQEEIMRVSEAAYIPVVWATQVLDNLARKGVPTRSEITDAAQAQRTECVMLNKGNYIKKAVKTLDKILRRMQRFQKKKQIILPKLEQADQLKLSHKKYDIQ